MKMYCELWSKVMIKFLPLLKCRIYSRDVMNIFKFLANLDMLFGFFFLHSSKPKSWLMKQFKQKVPGISNFLHLYSTVPFSRNSPWDHRYCVFRDHAQSKIFAPSPIFFTQLTFPSPMKVQIFMSWIIK